MKNNRNVKTQKKGLPTWLLAIIVLVVISVLGIGAVQISNMGAGQYPSEINVSQASDLRTQGAFILDVRQPEEWAQFHIPGATLIPLGDLPNRLNEVPKDKEVVVVCRTGHRSAQGRDILKNAGFTKVTSMAGGVTQWQTAGLPIATGE
jgi:rhodanese-related sulfurtransferase